MQLCAQWWLVITRPSGDTNDPEQPPASRTEESCASPSHFDSGLKPYFFATFALGKLSNVHMPSSASAARGTAAASKKAASRFMSAPESAARAAHIPCSDRALCLQGRAPSRVLTYATPPHFREAAGFLAMVARTLPRCACPVAWLRLSSAVHSSTGGSTNEVRIAGVPRRGVADWHRFDGPGHPTVSSPAEDRVRQHIPEALRLLHPPGPRVRLPDADGIGR